MTEPTIPDRGWQEWGRSRTKAKQGPEWGPASFVRATRQPGSLILRCVAPERSVACWRPANPLLQPVITKTNRPRILEGQAVSIHLRDHPWGMTFWGTPVPIPTTWGQGSPQLVIAPAVATGWTDPADRWAR